MTDDETSPDDPDERAPLTPAAAYLTGALDLPCLDCDDEVDGDEIAPHGINPELIEDWDVR